MGLHWDEMKEGEYVTMMADDLDMMAGDQDMVLHWDDGRRI